MSRSEDEIQQLIQLEAPTRTRTEIEMMLSEIVIEELKKGSKKLLKNYKPFPETKSTPLIKPIKATLPRVYWDKVNDEI